MGRRKLRRRGEVSAMKLWDWIVLGTVAAVLFLAARKVVRDRRRGKLSCGGDCAHCMQGCGVKRQ